MDKQECELSLNDLILNAIGALNELKDISISYNAEFEGEGTFVRLDKKSFDQLTNGLGVLILHLGLNVDKEK